MNTTRINSGTFALAAVVCAAMMSSSSTAAVPEVTSVVMSQASSSRLVTITYTLQDAPAVITLDVQTNATGGTWASIGGQAVWNAQGDVWKKVGDNLAVGQSFNGSITWRPDLSWPDHKIADGGARAVVTAWALDNTPDYMVVDIASTAQQNTQTYYPAADFVPGGVSNGLYKTTTLLMRKIMAKDVRWTMGSVAEPGRGAAREATHQVMLTNNYYIGVYPVTQTQWYQVTGFNPSIFTTEGAMRPVDKVSYTDIRQGQGTSSAAAPATGGVYPDSPHSESFLGLLYTRTGIDFDLPSDAEWEFAARAGNGEGYWGDGSHIQIDSNNKDANLDRLGRYLNNPTTNSSKGPSADIAPSEGGTAIVGSYAPNAWGIYDMHGNVWEWCLDWYADVANIAALNGAVNTTSNGYGARVVRGGAYNEVPGGCRSAQRYPYFTPTSRNNGNSAGSTGVSGFRVTCTAGLR